MVKMKINLSAEEVSFITNGMLTDELKGNIVQIEPFKGTTNKLDIKVSVGEYKKQTTLTLDTVNSFDAAEFVSSIKKHTNLCKLAFDDLITILNNHITGVYTINIELDEEYDTEYYSELDIPKNIQTPLVNIPEFISLSDSESILAHFGFVPLHIKSEITPKRTGSLLTTKLCCKLITQGGMTAGVATITIGAVEKKPAFYLDAEGVNSLFIDELHFRNFIDIVGVMTVLNNAHQVVSMGIVDVTIF